MHFYGFLWTQIQIFKVHFLYLNVQWFKKMWVLLEVLWDMNTIFMGLIGIKFKLCLLTLLLMASAINLDSRGGAIIARIPKLWIMALFEVLRAKISLPSENID